MRSLTRPPRGCSASRPPKHGAKLAWPPTTSGSSSCDKTFGNLLSRTTVAAWRRAVVVFPEARGPVSRSAGRDLGTADARVAGDAEDVGAGGAAGDRLDPPGDELGGDGALAEGAADLVGGEDGDLEALERLAGRAASVSRPAWSVREAADRARWRARDR